jgi:hypothetical protein
MTEQERRAKIADCRNQVRFLGGVIEYLEKLGGHATMTRKRIAQVKEEMTWLAGGK